MTHIIEITGQIADAAPAVDKNNGMKIGMVILPELEDICKDLNLIESLKKIKFFSSRKSASLREGFILILLMIT